MTHDSHGDAPMVRVVVLNWNSAEHTRRCVRSLLASDYPADRLQVVVVDNGSVDGSVPVLQSLFPQVTFRLNRGNLGFAEGCNRALRDLAGIDAVALVNNDATVEPGWLWPLVHTLEADPTVGAAAAKLLFATEFVSVTVEVADEPTGPDDMMRLVSVRADGVDVTAKVIPGEGVANRPHQTEPLRIDREVRHTAVFHVPVDALTEHVTMEFEGTRSVLLTCGSARSDSATFGGTSTVAAAGERLRRINSLGTGLTPWCEGLELRFGEPDSTDIAPEEVPGWCGGGVLLRAGYLAEVGLFDPHFFAYYEDTDLSWRGRRSGWRTVTAPTSVLHHVHGATAGSTWPGFFFLNYRNWLLTAVRNGERSQVAAALKMAWHYSWPYARFNVVGPLRRLRRPDWAITGRWLRIAGSALAALPRVLSTRRTSRRVTGSHSASAGPGWLQPESAPRSPKPRAGGPTICYVDATSLLEPGSPPRGKQLVAQLALETDDLELVPLRRDPDVAGMRRLGTAEMWTLLGATTASDDPVAAGQLELNELADGTVILEIEGVDPGPLRSLVAPSTRTVTVTVSPEQPAGAVAGLLIEAGRQKR